MDDWKYVNKIWNSDDYSTVSDSIGLTVNSKNNIDTKIPDNLSNPLLNMYKRVFGINNKKWDTSIESYEDLLFIPSESFLEYLVTKDILEVNAGCGYWSYIINQNGGNSTPVDTFPEDIPQSLFPSDHHRQSNKYNGIFWNINRPYKENFNSFPYRKKSSKLKYIWTDVDVANYESIKESDKEYVLLSKFPDGNLVNKILDMIIDNNKTLILICDLNPKQYSKEQYKALYRLDKYWTIINTYSVHNFRNTNASGHVLIPPKTKMFDEKP